MSIDVSGFFDIETSNWDQFVLGGLLDCSGVYFDTSDPDELFEACLEISGTLWSWNGGRFDVLWALEQARRLGLKVEVSASGSRVTRAQVGTVTFRDSAALIPMALDKAAPIVGQSVEKNTGLPCTDLCRQERESATSCGGYCSISSDLSPRLWKRLRTYLEKDCRVGFDVTQGVIEIARKRGYLLTGTVGGSSYKTMAARCGIGNADWPRWRRYKMARAGYFGGRCQVIRPALDGGHRYDIHAAYPAALSTIDLPVGASMEVGGAKAKRAYEREKEGVFQADCFVPDDMFIPPLPWRLGGRRDGRGSRICYPTGPVRGSWTSLELRYAESVGVRVRIVGGLVWSDAEPVLKPFVDEVWAHRASVGPASAEGRWCKWFANSVTGKLAESPRKDAIHIHPSIDRIKACGGADGRGGINVVGAWGCGGDDGCTGACDKWRMLDRNGEIWSSPIFRIPDNGHVHWAAYMTAATRTELHRQLTADGKGGTTAVYCDTDSVYSSIERAHRIGTDLGEWGSDGVMTDWVAVAPKCYAYTDAEGARIVRAKGLSRITPADFNRFVAGETVTCSRGVKGFRSAAASGNLFVRKSIRRSRRDDGIYFGDRLLHSDGLTYPQTVRRLREWHKTQKSS